MPLSVRCWRLPVLTCPVLKAPVLALRLISAPPLLMSLLTRAILFICTELPLRLTLPPMARTSCRGEEELVAAPLNSSSSGKPSSDSSSSSQSPSRWAMILNMASLSPLPMLTELIVRFKARTSLWNMSPRSTTRSARLILICWKAAERIGLYSSKRCASSRRCQLRLRSDSSCQEGRSPKYSIAKKRVLVSLWSFARPLYQPKSKMISQSMPASSFVSRKAHSSKEPLSVSLWNFPAGTVKASGLFRLETKSTSG
mmetsp:Transcript_63701/g.136937  ORF Transcript_63701/g.136937 Transcript_63701/m.136937 type:complete len:256 (+) Transcript_63701:1138-1905(+)